MENRILVLTIIRKALIACAIITLGVTSVWAASVDREMVRATA